MSEIYALSVRDWGRTHFNVSEPTAYRIINSEDPPPLMILNNRRKVAIGSQKYVEWLERKTVSHEI